MLIPNNLGTNSVSTHDWLAVSGAMNFMVYQPLLTQFEQITERSSALEQPVRNIPYEFALDERRSPDLATSFETNFAASPSDYRPIWQVIKEIRDQVPSQDWNQMPVDGSKRLDYYLKGEIGKAE